MLIILLLNVLVQFNDTEFTKHVRCKVTIYDFISLNNKTGNVSVTQNSGTFANHCCRRKAISVTYSVCVCVCVLVAVVIQNAKRMRHIILSPVACSTLT